MPSCAFFLAQLHWCTCAWLHGTAEGLSCWLPVRCRSVRQFDTRQATSSQDSSSSANVLVHLRSVNGGSPCEAKGLDICQVRGRLP